MADYLGIAAAALTFGQAIQPAMAQVQGGLVDVFAQSGANANANSVYDYIDQYGAANNMPITASEAFSTSDTGGSPVATLASAMNANHAYAILPDASHGTVDFTGSSTAIVTAAGYSTDTGASASAYGVDAFSYLFSITTAGTLTVTYDTKDNGLVSSVPEIDLFAPFPAPIAYRFLPINGNGSVAFALAPGDYTFEILSDALSQNAVQAGAIGVTQATADEQFGFAIDAAVPEPATWLMMLIGFGTLGLTTRRGRWHNRHTAQGNRVRFS